MVGSTPHELTREELFDLVWSEPVARVAERYGLSGAGLRKLCLRHDVPVPPRGHWARVKAGKKVKRPKLPSNGSGVRPGVPALEPRAPSPSMRRDRDPVVRARREFEAEPRNAIRVNRRRAASSAWAVSLRSAAATAGRNAQDLLPISVGEHPLGATVSSRSLGRVPHLVATVEHACRVRGFLEESRGGSRLVVEGVPLFLHVGERSRRLESEQDPADVARYPWLRGRKVYTYEPSGALTIAIGTSREFSWYYVPMSHRVADAPSRPLEERLNELMVRLIRVAVDANERARMWAEREERRRAEEAAARERALAVQRREEEWRGLEGLAEQSMRAERLRALVERVRVTGVVPASAGAPSELEAWIRWASAFADELDPLVEAD